MKILYLNPDRGIPVLGAKGASVHVREFVTTLARQGHEVTVVCATLGEGNAPPPGELVELRFETDEAELQKETQAWGLPTAALDDRITRRELQRLAYDRTFARRIAVTLEAARFWPDFIYERHALFHRAGGTLAQMLGIPRLLEVNAPLIREQERFRGLVLKDIATVAERDSFKCAHAIIAVSREVADYIASCGMSLDKILTIPNGVDTVRFCPNAGRETIRNKLGLGQAPVIGFVGSFKAWHGIGFLVDAFVTIAQKHPGVKLLAVGEGPELRAAQDEISARGLEDQVIFTGRVPHAEIPSYLAAMDLSVAPYLSDQDFYFSPLKVVESLATGTPVVASRLGQLEYLIDDGKTGLLFVPGDKNDFINKTLGLIRETAHLQEMSVAARARALSNFSWKIAGHRVFQEAQRQINAARAA